MEMDAPLLSWFLPLIGILEHNQKVRGGVQRRVEAPAPPQTMGPRQCLACALVWGHQH